MEIISTFSEDYRLLSFLFIGFGQHYHSDVKVKDIFLLTL